ncbi:hypothetical protein M9H77_02154 [Catharanthus roseus]|uniref:Uncharacterized protein n=1 Tax=Catharanthus roseus TaxID=4058 RepID=A0ACC0C7T4_CATRO|nr:hypothetical protein M9H77_02154 [Catharanthus roseus]
MVITLKQYSITIWNPRLFVRSIKSARDVLERLFSRIKWASENSVALEAVFPSNLNKLMMNRKKIYRLRENARNCKEKFLISSTVENSTLATSGSARRPYEGCDSMTNLIKDLNVSRINPTHFPIPSLYLNDDGGTLAIVPQPPDTCPFLPCPPHALTYPLSRLPEYSCYLPQPLLSPRHLNHHHALLI